MAQMAPRVDPKRRVTTALTTRKPPRRRPIVLPTMAVALRATLVALVGFAAVEAVADVGIAAGAEAAGEIASGRSRL